MEKKPVLLDLLPRYGMTTSECCTALTAFAFADGRSSECSDSTGKLASCFGEDFQPKTTSINALEMKMTLQRKDVKCLWWA